MNIQKYRDYFNKIAVFYKSDAANYWNSITPCCIDKKPNYLGRYYLNFISKYNFPGEFDDTGVPLYRLRDSDPFYHPIVISQYALGIYEKYLSTDSESRIYLDKFLLQANWLTEHCEYVMGNFGWGIRYNVPEYNLKSPWLSAMAQGEAISILCRAFLLTSNNKYIDIAEKALLPYTVNADKGGFVNFFNNIPIYEEFPSPNKTVGVLNGFIFSLLGLYDLLLLTNNKLARKLFEGGIDSLKNILGFYDIGYWSQYYLFDYPDLYPASYTYHILAAEQLKVLDILTNEKIFSHYSRRWFKQGKGKLHKFRVLLNKITYSRKLNWSDTGRRKR